jgi:BirA family transcriptional regulator, biotin operon repressor / biotin---[acetyl-CoA-carboxylase] ligase
MIIGSKYLFFENLSSTNTQAVNLLKKEKPDEGTILYTNFQTSGRGCHTNKWESEMGKNLLMSIILYPSFIRPDEQFIISMAISLGISDFLSPLINDCSVKWPNDIYIKSDKIAGILIESSIINNEIEYTVAGIGLNINQEKFVSDAPNPVSLFNLTHIRYDTDECRIKLADTLDKKYKQLISGNTGKIRSEYISKLYRFNAWAGYRDETGEFTGRILSVSDNGQLIVENQHSGIREYSFGEIEFIP